MTSPFIPQEDIVVMIVRCAFEKQICDSQHPNGQKRNLFAAIVKTLAFSKLPTVPAIFGVIEPTNPARSILGVPFVPPFFFRV